MRRLMNFSLVLLLGVFLAGCAASKKKGAAEVEDSSVNVQADATSSGLASDGTSSGEALASADSEPIIEDDPLGKRVIYFEFDSNALTPEAQSIAEAHAEYLAGNPGMAVVLEGHADERGTREYNLALGERRANGIMNFLIVNGASRNQIETVSYGEERPADRASSDAAYQRNRRVEIADM